jgi:hypothetical protein
MKRLQSILIALALATVPCVGAVAIRALWPIPAAVATGSAQVNRVLDSSKFVETIAGVAIATESVRLNRSLDNLDRQVAAIGPAVRKVDPVLDKLGHSIDLANAPCVPGPCGTFADVGKTLNTVRGTFGQIEVAADHENRNLATLDLQEATLFADFHGTATRANTSLDTFNGLLARPSVTLMLDNGGKFTTTAVAVEEKLAACTLHPTLPCVLKSDILFGAQVGGYLLK